MEVLKSIVNWELWSKMQKPKKIQTEINFSSRINLSDYNLTKDKLPMKGRDIIAFDNEGNLHNCYLSNCDIEPNCTEWLDSRSHKVLDVDVIIWKYDENYLWI